MTQRRSTHDAIRLRGVRHNNLKNFDLDVPIGKLTVITGLSGSGKSSLAFDTLFAEGQRRYIETFSPYARQFFDRMDKPRVDRIEGIPPAIAIEQRNAVRSTRSTVGTMTEICDYMKVVWPHLAQLHCQKCDQLVRPEPPQVVWEKIQKELEAARRELLVTFDLPLSEKLSLTDSLALISRQGYQRLLIGQEIVRIEDASARVARNALRLTVIQDRLNGTAASRARFIEASEQAYHFGKGRLTVHFIEQGATTQSSQFRPLPFSRGFHCATCDLDYPEPTSSLFSFNHPVGACPACKGFGRIISIDYNLAIPDRSKTLAAGCVKPWQTGMSAECQSDLAKACRKQRVPMDVPFEELSQAHQQWVIAGDAGYDSNDSENSWPRKWYGVKGYFRWLESKAYKMHVRVLLSRYRAYTTCEACSGKRLKPEALLFGIGRPNRSTEPTVSLPNFYAMPCDQALAFVEEVAGGRTQSANDPLALALGEVRARLRYLVDVGLGYLTLDRPTRTLSGGETERVNLTTCLGTRLVNTLFVLDEPSVGLHARDTARLVRILKQLRDAGNTVTVVEHEASVIRAADQIVDLGPGQGEKGGHIVFVGPVQSLLTAKNSLTGQYLSGRKQIPLPTRRPMPTNAPDTYGRLFEQPLPYGAIPSPSTETSFDFLRIRNASRHNLKNLDIDIPLRRFVALTGVSGSGKTTLVREVLLPALQAKLNRGPAPNIANTKASDRMEMNRDAGEDEAAANEQKNSVRLEGWETLAQVVIVDQSPLGKTPRSNPVVYIGAFDDVRDLYAQTAPARQRGLGGSAFSFNSGVGQCERCRGAGFEKIEMQFLSDVFIRCSECNGRRYRAHILDIKLPSDSQEWSIADMLEATVDDALAFLANYSHVPAGRRALARLKLLQDVGLGYLRLGQPINTLSGGESQRLKLVSHLADSAAAQPAALPQPTQSRSSPLAPKNTRAEVKEWLAARGGGRASAKELAPKSRNAFAPGNEGWEIAAATRRGTLFLFDEPTTGLHFDDVRVLLQVFQRIVDAGHSVVVIEHNLDVIKCADWVIDLGPDAGERGGQLVIAGTPEQVTACSASHTGKYLRELMECLDIPGRAVESVMQSQ
jgi:excinuclease ABC subunit A